MFCNIIRTLLENRYINATAALSSTFSSLLYSGGNSDRFGDRSHPLFLQILSCVGSKTVSILSIKGKEIFRLRNKEFILEYLSI
jgi:hypothetical protein